MVNVFVLVSISQEISLFFFWTRMSFTSIRLTVTPLPNFSPSHPLSSSVRLSVSLFFSNSLSIALSVCLSLLFSGHHSVFCAYLAFSLFFSQSLTYFTYSLLFPLLDRFSFCSVCLCSLWLCLCPFFFVSLSFCLSLLFPYQISLPA